MDTFARAVVRGVMRTTLAVATLCASYEQQLRSGVAWRMSSALSVSNQLRARGERAVDRAVETVEASIQGIVVQVYRRLGMGESETVELDLVLVNPFMRRE